MSSSLSQTPIPTRKAWSPEEDQLLQELRQNQSLDWIEVARQIGGRNPSQCAQRWKRIKGYKLRRQWTQEEDEKLKQLVDKHGFHWSKISPHLNQRSGKQIREHYLNQLRPDLNNDPWSQEEDEKIVEIYKQVGGRWSVIQKHLKGRSENSIKNRFYSFLRNKYLNIKNPYYVIPEKLDKVESKQESKKETCVQQAQQMEQGPQQQQQNFVQAFPQQFCQPFPQFMPIMNSHIPYAMVMPFFIYPSSYHPQAHQIPQAPQQ